jgi:DNA-binding CsgD family transcriptional regulator
MAASKTLAAIGRERGYNEASLSGLVGKLRTKRDDVPASTYAVQWDDEGILLDLAAGKTLTAIAREMGYNECSLSRHLKRFRNKLNDVP